MNDIGWTDAEICESREKSNEIKNAYKRGYEQAKKEFERPQGKWIRQGFAPYGTCNICGELCEINNFCGNCGADMQGKEE